MNMLLACIQLKDQSNQYWLLFNKSSIARDLTIYPTFRLRKMYVTALASLLRNVEVAKPSPRLNKPF
jgi:hypothetical protein